MRIRLVQITQSDFDHEKTWGLFLVFTFFFLQLIPSWFIESYPCFFRKLTGLPCPTCGITRTLLFLGQGDLSAAFRLSPLFTIGALGSGLYAAYALCAWIFRTRRIRVEFKSRKEFLLAAGICFLLVGLNWVLSVRKGL